jgi:CMP-N,N'-diacetyllegionaminic acid synthase
LDFNKRVLAIIPARGGSKRLPGKNKKELGGKALVRYVIEAALKASLIQDIAVSTDDEDILAISREYPRIIPIKRPAIFATDQSPAIEYVHHTLEYLAKAYDAIVILQPSSPFTTAEDIDNTINLLWQMEADSAVSVMKLDHAIHPVKLKILRGGKLLPYWEEEKGRMAAHELLELYVRNCSIYVANMKSIKAGKIIGDDCAAYVMPRERSLDINDPIDFEFAQFLISKNEQ